jgi:hypothetical protein
MRHHIKRDQLPEHLADEIRQAIRRSGIKPVADAVGVSRHGLMTVLAGMSTPAHTLLVATRWETNREHILATLPVTRGSAKGVLYDETAHYRCEV